LGTQSRLPLCLHPPGKTRNCQGFATPLRALDSPAPFPADSPSRGKGGGWSVAAGVGRRASPRANLFLRASEWLRVPGPIFDKCRLEFDCSCQSSLIGTVLAGRSIRCGPLCYTQAVSRLAGLPITHSSAWPSGQFPTMNVWVMYYLFFLMLLPTTCALRLGIMAFTRVQKQAGPNVPLGPKHLPASRGGESLFPLDRYLS
jgi:hypothetical protein